ncbi:ArsR family transcriptional regulator [Candidatus Thorarchaeota archaeon]|nr:MAG: ArsR family transcriptional regulator [Candidatus Thorarchaeota archaeon]
MNVGETLTIQINHPGSKVKFRKNELEEIVTLFKALGDPSRLEIVALLSREPNLCVTDVGKKLKMSISRVSHHLKLLEHLGFVKHRQEGKQVYHRIEDDCIIDIMARAHEHVRGK